MLGGTSTEVRGHWIWSPSSTFPHQNRPIYYWLLVFHRQSTFITENSRKRIMQTKCLSKWNQWYWNWKRKLYNVVIWLKITAVCVTMGASPEGDTARFLPNKLWFYCVPLLGYGSYSRVMDPLDDPEFRLNLLSNYDAQPNLGNVLSPSI